MLEKLEKLWVLVQKRLLLGIETCRFSLKNATLELHRSIWCKFELIKQVLRLALILFQSFHRLVLFTEVVNVALWNLTLKNDEKFPSFECSIGVTVKWLEKVVQRREIGIDLNYGFHEGANAPSWRSTCWWRLSWGSKAWSSVVSGSEACRRSWKTSSCVLWWVVIAGSASSCVACAILRRGASSCSSSVGTACRSGSWAGNRSSCSSSSSSLAYVYVNVLSWVVHSFWRFF